MKEENFKSPISFLGICDRYNEVSIGIGQDLKGNKFEITRKDLIGLREIHLSNIFPLPSDEFFIVLLIDKEYLLRYFESGSKEGVSITVEGPRNKIVSTIMMSGSVIGEGEIKTKYMLQAIKLEGIYSEPGEYTLFTNDSKESKQFLGSFLMSYQPSLPLTPERIQAIKSDPLAAKHLRFIIGCKKCSDEYKIFGGIDKDKKDQSEAQGYIWYQDLPDNFNCSCGEVNQDLQYVRDNLHSLLGYKAKRFSYEESIERSYTIGALEETARLFQKLIEDATAPEEHFQKFIEENPILLSCFTPQLLKFKAPITAKYKTDFVVLNPRNELVLIEIEKPTTHLFKAKGDRHSELTHAFDQVENWLTASKRNRLGLIDDVDMKGLNIDNITNIRGAIIAGRTSPSDALYTEKLRGRADIDFYTYDDLLKSFVSIINSYKNL